MFEKITSPFTEFGVSTGLAYLAGRLLRRVSSGLGLQFYDFMVQPIPETRLLPSAMARQIEVRQLERGDAELQLIPVPPHVVRARFEQGAICLGAFQRSKFIGYMWFCFRSYDEDEVRCTYVLSPAPDSVFDFDFYLFPEHRLGLGFVALWDSANNFLRERGIVRTFSRLTRFNVTSQKAHAHLGWQRLGTALFLRTWRVQVFMASIYPYVGITVHRSIRIPLEVRVEPTSSQ